MKKIFVLFSLLIVGIMAFAQNPCPQVIPALQQWKGAKGILTLPTQGSIVVNPSNADILTSTATILAEDLKELLGWNYTIIIGKAKKNDIYLSLADLLHSE